MTLIRRELAQLGHTSAGRSFGAVAEQRADGQPVLSGYASVFFDGTPGTEYKLSDKVVERVDRNAFDATLKRDDQRALYGHDALTVLGRKSAGTLRLWTDARGLRYEIVIDTHSTRALDVYAAVVRRDVTGASFGFRIDDEAFVRDGDRVIRTLRAISLDEISVVAWPAYLASTATASGTARASAATAADLRRRRCTLLKMLESCADPATQDRLHDQWQQVEVDLCRLSVAR